MNGEGIIVPLDRRFVVYPGAARVDQGAGVVCPGSCDMLIEKLKKITIGNSGFYTGSSTPAAGVEEGAM